MNTYLAIMITILVITQIVRITQNTINLHLQNRAIKRDLSWLKDNDVSERDFEIQRTVFYLLFDKLTKEGYTDHRLDNVGKE